VQDTRTIEVVEVGDFIEVMAWRVTGCVVELGTPMHGAEDAIRVLLMESPEDEVGRWYHLEPGQFKVVG
jgi:hypothetical protein